MFAFGEESLKVGCHPHTTHTHETDTNHASPSTYLLQAYILFRSRLAEPFTFSSGEESLEVALFAPEEIPFHEIAFSSVTTCLK